MRSHEPATVPGTVVVVVAVGVGVALVVVMEAVGVAVGVGFDGVSGSAVTVGSGSVEAGVTVPGEVVVAVAGVDDSTAVGGVGVPPEHADSASPSTAAAATDAGARRRPPLDATVVMPNI